jgi:hypothetical protein
MSKHTPGPWLKSASGSTVYALHGNPPRNRFSAHCQAGRQDDASADELDANARLIAAAPELLQELKHAVVHEYNPFEPDNQSERYYRWAALIAKAEGK